MSRRSAILDGCWGSALGTRVAATGLAGALGLLGLGVAAAPPCSAPFVHGGVTTRRRALAIQREGGGVAPLPARGGWREGTQGAGVMGTCEERRHRQCPTAVGRAYGNPLS